MNFIANSFDNKTKSKKKKKPNKTTTTTNKQTCGILGALYFNVCCCYF